MTSNLDRLCEARGGVRADFVYGAARKPAAWDGAAHNWRVTLRHKGRRLTVDFYGGAAVTNPSAADVLSGLILDASVPDSFAEFCAEFGYDEDSRAAEATWRACVAMGPRVRRLLGDDFEAFARAER